MIQVLAPACPSGGHALRFSEPVRRTFDRAIACCEVSRCGAKVGANGLVGCFPGNNAADGEARPIPSPHTKRTGVSSGSPAGEAQDKPTQRDNCGWPPL